MYRSPALRLWGVILPVAAVLLVALAAGGAKAQAPTSAVKSFLTPCGTLNFAPPVSYAATTRPRSAATGFFNSDTAIDLVVTDYSANSISVFLGNGNGTFQAAVNYAVGVHPVSVAVADFNGDQKSDLVIANYDSANVSILLGNGDGTFGTATNFPSNIGPYGVTVGDFNEDGFQDVATSNVNFGQLNVMLGNGNGTLQGYVTYNTGSRPQVIATADFNSDGHLDLAVPNYAGSSISVLFGVGNGAFQAAVNYPVEAGPAYLTAGDLNADGKPDIVLAHYGTGDLSVLMGVGDGTFQTPVTYPTGGLNPLFVSIADWNGDGIPDLGAPNYGSNTAAILPGTGGGVFGSALTFNTGAGTSPVTVLGSDFDNDGRVDFFTANENTNDISVFLNTCTAGGTSTSTVTAVPSTTQTALPSVTATSTTQPTGTATHTSTAVTSRTATSVPTATSTPCVISFSDVSPSDYFYEPVRYLYCKFAVSGYSDNTFRPYLYTTRGQLSKIITIGEGWPLYTTGGPHFTDVDQNNPFYAYIETAYHHGVISGYADGTFRWGNNITRAQLSKIVDLAQGWDINPIGGPHFSDVGPNDPFYGYIETAYDHSVISGYADGTFRPGNPATRGQICKIVYNAITYTP